MREFTFRVDMDSASVKEIMYNSQIKRVQVLTDQGLHLDLPVGNFQRFVSYNGIHGRFLLTLDGSKFVSMEKIES